MKKRILACLCALCFAVAIGIWGCKTKSTDVHFQTGISAGNDTQTAPREKGYKPKPFVYSVKVLCDRLEPLPTVFHWTEINIHNPDKDKTANYTKKFLVSGKQGAPSEIEPRSMEDQLPPNGAFEIDCDDYHRHLGLPLTQPVEGFVEIVTDLPLAVVGVYDKCAVQPRTDVFMRSEAELTFEVFGQTEILRLSGPVLVKKGPMVMDMERGKFSIETEIVAMEMTGESELLGGGVMLLNNASFQSGGKIVGNMGDNGEPIVNEETPADSYFDVMFELFPQNPELAQEIGSVINMTPTRVTAQITSIPPGPPVLENTKQNINRYCSSLPVTCVSTNSGAQVCRVLEHCHGPNPVIVKPPQEHPKVPCEAASIDVEYVEPVLKGHGLHIKQ